MLLALVPCQSILDTSEQPNTLNTVVYGTAALKSNKLLRKKKKI